MNKEELKQEIKDRAFGAPKLLKERYGFHIPDEWYKNFKSLLDQFEKAIKEDK